MRSPPRSFKIEFKTRSAKSRALGWTATEDHGDKIPQLSFLDTRDFVAARSNRASGHDAVMEAANAVFARNIPTAPAPETPVPETPAPSSVSAGRVLPSLIDESDPLAIRLAEVGKKSRRERVARRAEAIAPLRPKMAKAPPASAAPRAPDKQAAKEITRETPNVTAQDRQSRSVHKRRLLDAELKAGEKWKRRLCAAAR
jgi:hypothetical protein